MKTILTSLRVHDLERSLDFYGKVGFEELGRVVIEDGSTLVMLNLPGDGDTVTLELVYNQKSEPFETGTGLDHIAVQVDDLSATLARLAGMNVAFDGPHLPGGEAGPKTAFLHDPDGFRFELVQWPPGHPPAMTRADFQ